MAWVTKLRKRARRRLASILTRLLLINLIVVAVPIAGIWFAKLYERQLLHGHEQDMIHQAQVLRETLVASTNFSLDGHKPMLSRISEHTGLRIRLVDSDGKVHSDSGGPVAILIGRNEVTRALQGAYGSQVRFAPRRQRLNLFSALPIHLNQEVVGVIYTSRSTAEVTRNLVHLRYYLLRIFWVSVALTVVMTLYLAATISRPLKNLARRAERIAQGDTVLPLRIKGESEIAILARSFERMRARLSERANESANMAADISHEFKSPLTSIRGAAELLQDEAGEDAETRSRFLSNIVDDATRMSRLVTRLLELNRLQADISDAKKFDLMQLLKERLRDLPGLQLDLGTPPCPVIGRQSLIATAVENLVENAQQHAPTGATVSVCLSSRGTHYNLTVTNTGLQVSKATLEQMWQRFFTTRSSEGGSGIGLAIVASAVQSHGGQVHATSSQHQTTVGFTLPKPR